MTKDDNTAVSVRMPQEWLDRMDALVDVLAQEPELAGVIGVTRSMVIRRAILLGMEHLEAQHGLDESTV